MNCAVRIHCVRCLRVEVADRVIRDRREVDDRVESLEVLRRYIPDVAGPLFVAFRLTAKVTSVVPTDIQTDDLMTSGLHEGNEHRPDVAAVAIHQNSHRDVLILLPTSCA